MQVDSATGKPTRPIGPARLPRRKLLGKATGWGGLVANPRNTVLIVLAAVLGLGGGRRWWLSVKARRLVARLAEADVSAVEVESIAAFGREGLIELFRLLETAPGPAIRQAAGHALAKLWARDQMIPEEEKAVVRRGYAVDWRARKRYPRGLHEPIPILIDYGVPFLADGAGGGVSPNQLEWSHRVINAGRAALEILSPWKAGPGRVSFSIEPGDFAGNGPHRLVLQSRVRTRDLTSSWELELPQIPFSFEFDPNLSVDALLTLPDEARGERIARSIRLVTPESAEQEPRFLGIGPDLAIRNPPEIQVETPLPSDLAHRVVLEFASLDSPILAGRIVLAGQASATESATIRFPIGPLGPVPEGPGIGPGEHRVRVILSVDPGSGWADPAIRSVWPGEIATDWQSVAIIRK